MENIKLQEANVSAVADTSTAEHTMYDMSFFQREFAANRKQLSALLLLPLLYTSLLMWGCLSLYFGSLTTYNNLSKLTVLAVDLDGGFLGQQIIAGIKKAQTASAPGGLDWQFDTNINSTGMSQEQVLDEQAWAVIEISPNASANLELALSAKSDALATPYNPLAAITLFYASARNQITASSKVVPAILATINPLLTQAAIAHTAQYITKLNSSSSTLGALSLTAKACPQCLAAPFALNQTDLIPFSSVPAVVTGSTMVGLIFLLTFAFSVFNILRNAASVSVIGIRLCIRDALVLRTVNALSAYLILALWYTLINLAFGVPMKFGDGIVGTPTGNGGEGKGFMLFWMLNWCTMAAVGLPMEGLFTLIGLRWSGYFLTFWIIVNVSGAFTSFELVPGFYLYGYGFPFYNSIQGARTLIFGTKSHLGLNFGVLVAWMVLGWLGVMVFTTENMRRNKKRKIHNLP